MSDLHQRAELLLGSPVRSSRRISGADLSMVWALDLADGRSVIAKQGKGAYIEAEMLRAIAATRAPVPAVLAAEDELVLMERLESTSGPSVAWESLAEALALLHGAPGPGYGWNRDYAFGPVAIGNHWNADWAAFWADNRLRCHLPHVDFNLARRLGALADRCGELLPRDPPPALLHGDLWGGNILVAGGRVTGLIDPACYHGDREVDAAMLTLFDLLSPAFVERLALPQGWQRRQPLYRLWPLLVHLRLFGAAYRGRIEADLYTLGF
ncbi:fructosamine kinase family protein [Sphingomonas sp. HITSZ_GF]|uniref:fructosamine kinase family protein n=1 Tax=Sphingomonas sp. HITSZ_GF TaxID=3037247 RepID=UPI00240DB481|nr:fructosamine kinase family protein [Sphingomonas sp. HITSZ_GF]MDG2532327.1 fructosamine kinase family protein [Sphingomonas sp. HITSZ_GF]